MSVGEGVPRSGFKRGHNGLDAARAAFEWLVTGPDPLAVDGRLFEDLPARRVPLDELRELLLDPRCTQTLRDAAWTHLVQRTRGDSTARNTADTTVSDTTGGGRADSTRGAWTIGAVGVALPALTSIAKQLSAKFAGDRADVHAAVLAGFVSELAEVDLHRTGVMARLRWTAYRAGETAVREALDAPAPAGHGFASILPSPPSGHPDLVLARAIAEGAITADEADLIAATRLDGVPLIDAGAIRNLAYPAARQARWRAEQRLVAYLRDDAVDTAADTSFNTAQSGSLDRDLQTRVADTMTVTSAAQRAVHHDTGTDTGTDDAGDAVAAPAVPSPTVSMPRRRTSGSTPGVPR